MLCLVFASGGCGCELLVSVTVLLATVRGNGSGWSIDAQALASERASSGGDGLIDTTGQSGTVAVVSADDDAGVRGGLTDDATGGSRAG
jgi:hypothetical protein